MPADPDDGLEIPADYLPQVRQAQSYASPIDRKFILNQVRFPLDAFTGVDLTDIRSVELNLSWVDQGVIDIADLAFSRGAA